MKPGQKVTPAGVLVARHGIPEQEWLALRTQGIGGSDVATLLGMNPYTSARELYHEKRGELPEIPRSDALERAAKWGHLHEPLIAAEFARQHGVRTRRIGLLQHADRPWMLANLDRQVHGCPDGPCLLEIKNRSAYKAGEWGPSGDPEGVPDREAIQTHHYLIVTGYGHAHVGVLLNGNDDRYYRVDFDPELAADLLAAEALFWQRVQDGNPPPLDGSGAASQFLDAMWPGRDSTELVLAPGEAGVLLAERKRLLARCSELDEQATQIGNLLKDMLGDAEIAVCDGEPVFTWKRNGTFAGKRFAQAHPDLAEKYTHLVPAIDAKSLAADHPETYRAFRARVLRIAGSGQ
jgi:putative phage-type endonuclease